MSVIVPSILNANNMHLGRDISQVVNNGIDSFHIDIMDGHFVPNLSYGPELIKDFRKEFIDESIEIHLMSDNLDTLIPLFVQTGCNLLEFHFEATTDVKKWIDYLHDNNIKAGIAVNPSTPLTKIIPFISYIDQILIMTVTPGFGGQKFNDTSITRITETRNILNERHLQIPIEVDGGINNETLKLAKNAGANKFVVGSYIFNGSSISMQIDKLHQAIN